MKIRKYLPFALAALSFAPLARADERPRPPSIVVGYCSGCHGIDGKSQLPYIPRLAGQNAEYTRRKLASFKAAEPAPVDEAFSRFGHSGNVSKNAGFTREASAHMVGIAHALPDTQAQAAAEWYASQQAVPGKTRNRKALEQGKNLFVNGFESKGLRACQSCHGSDAHGAHVVPRLAGQNAAYVVSQFALFRSGKQPNSPMTEIARRLEDDQVQAVAAYLQSR